jgi:very-short-patch-repair endonuclease
MCISGATWPNRARPTRAFGTLTRVQGVPGWPEAFRGSTAIRAGLVTRRVLHGTRFRRLFPDTYVPRQGRPGFGLRSRAAFRYVEGRGALANHSAAELLGASCGRPEAPAEVVVWSGRQRAHPGLEVSHRSVGPGELVQVDGILVTSPLRTAFDLARRGTLVERVVAVDALANAHDFAPDLLLLLGARNLGARGNLDLADVLTLADRRAASPMETRLRLVLVLGGLPRPQAQWPVQDEHARTVRWLDLAYPDARIGVEYDGAVHTGPEAVLRDIARHTALLDQGWQVFRYTKHDVRDRPELIVAQVGRALARARCT